MLFKSLTVLAATAAAVSAQLPNHIFFTSPIANDITFKAGFSETFSWQHTCKSGDSTSKKPTETWVYIVSANNPNEDTYLRGVTTFDCTKDKGTQTFTVPAQFAGDGNKYVFKIDVSPKPVYSGEFMIIPSGNGTSTSSSSTPTSRIRPSSSAPTIVLPTTAPPTNSSGTPPAGNNGKSAASSLVPALSGAAALAISAVGAMFL